MTIVVQPATRLRLLCACVPFACVSLMAGVAWRASVLQSLKRNSSLANAKYLQLVRLCLHASRCLQLLAAR